MFVSSVNHNRLLPLGKPEGNCGVFPTRYETPEIITNTILNLSLAAIYILQAKSKPSFSHFHVCFSTCSVSDWN